ncbi:MAG TPA: rhodanese-like domain-containing protein [Burkholderiales bacterium]|nr:rhodanese-like domain-containing protein [Burkholderiales bacterium]
MKQMNSRELGELLIRDDRTRIIDVCFARERAESGYIKNARHIPLYMPNWDPNPDFVDEVVRIAARDTPLVFVCRSGNRSCLACEIIEKQGYTEVYNLSEGYMGLLALKLWRAVNGEIDLLQPVRC